MFKLNAFERYQAARMFGLPIHKAIKAMIIGGFRQRKIEKERKKKIK